MKHKISDEVFISTVKESLSVREVLMKLGLFPTGNAYVVFHRRVKKLNLDISHFTGSGWRSGKTFQSKIPLSDYLSNKREINSFKLKKLLIKNQLLQEICSNCLLDNWLGNQIPLVLDHINGNCLDNRIENLRLLCPNCHFLTPTFAGKNKGKKKTQV